MKNVYKFYLIDKTSDRYFDVKAIVKKTSANNQDMATKRTIQFNPLSKD